MKTSRIYVTAELSSNSANSQLPPGSFRCGKNCSTCPYISHGLTTYTFFSSGETLPIKSNLTCDTKNLIYIIQCNRCNLRYIGETKRRLKDRFNEHRRAIDECALAITNLISNKHEWNSLHIESASSWNDDPAGIRWINIVI